MKLAVTVLVFCVAALLSLGMVMLYSSSMTQVGAHYLIMQLIWCGLGFVLCVGAGVQVKFIMPPVIVGVMGLAWSLWHDPMRRERILAFLHPEKYKNGVGYQSWQAMIALGSGGWTGLGLGNGRQKLGFVPEHHTDFILSIIGEELGLVATLLVVLGFVTITICGIYIAYKARDAFGLLLAAGLTLLIGLQAA